MTPSPPRWTPEQFQQGAEKAIEVFRHERLNEARADYSAHFIEAQGAIEHVLELTDDLRKLTETGIAAITGGYLEALRYVAAPPVSLDDLITLSGVPLRDFAAEDGWPAVVGTILAVVDTHRFSWLAGNREPTQAERHAAVISTAALIAARRMLTARANESKDAQETLVKDALSTAGLTEVRPRIISNLRTAPQPGEFCGESTLGSRKADVVVGLWDGRILAIECKVSNSQVNSIKRVKNDAAVKAERWTRELGDTLIVPAAVIAGVYHVKNLLSAQANGLTIWWSHDIAQMIAWITKTKPE